MNRSSHVLAKAEPIGVAVRQRAVRKISPLRPSQWFKGSTIKAPLFAAISYQNEQQGYGE
jgi:hypothetical protein